MRLLFTGLFLLLAAISLSGQRAEKKERFRITDEYQGYKIIWDTLEKANFLQSPSGGMNKLEIPHMNYPGKARFQHGFVYCSTGDMKALTDLSGRQILEPCHFIRFYKDSNLINAFICGAKSWIYLNFQGDTLCFGPTMGKNYVPPLGGKLNPAHVQKWNEEIKWGYLDDQARWVIPPKFEEAGELVDGYAKVKLNGLWGALNAKGEMVVQPKHPEKDFEIPKK